MKYPKIEKDTQNRFLIPSFKKGIGKSEECLENCLNMMIRDGCIMPRPAVKPTQNGIFYDTDGINEDYYEVIVDPPTFTGVQYFMPFHEYKIITALTGDLYSYYTLKLFFADRDGEVLEMEKLMFNRIDDNHFYTPISYTFFTAAPTKGSGIYVFVTTSNIDLTREHTAYEFDFVNNCWHQMGPSDFYTPTIYINGRGDSYNTADQNGTAYKYAPACPEERNLLEGSFLAYFTSDNYSSAFRLPLSELDNDNVFCRIYTQADRYVEWVILAGRNEDTQQFAGYDITLKCDRSSGLLQFFNGGVTFPIPRLSVFPNNNIRIKSWKTIENGYRKVIGSRYSARYESRIFFGGNELSPNKIFACRTENPLYFPKNQTFDAGDEGSAVSGLAAFKGELFAFKSDEIHRFSLIKGKARSFSGFSEEKGLRAFSSDSGHFDIISYGVGLLDKKSMCICNGRTVFLSSGSVYALDHTGKLSEIGAEIKHLLPENPKSLCSAFHKETYYLGFENKFFVMDSDNNWFYWEFPEAVYVSEFLNFADRLILLCSDRKNEFFYTAKLSNGKDTYYDNNYRLCESDIPCRINISRLNLSFPERAKSFDSIFASINSHSNLKISCNSYETAVSLNMSEEELENGVYRTVRINPDTYHSADLKLEFSSDKPFSLRDICIYWRKHSEVH